MNEENQERGIDLVAGDLGNVEMEVKEMERASKKTEERESFTRTF